MSRRNQLAGIDPLGNGEEQGETTSSQRPKLSMSDADAALFGALAQRESSQQTVRSVSIFNIYPDVQQPRRAVPSTVRKHWSGQPIDMVRLFNVWVKAINQEREQSGRAEFELDNYLWSERIEGRSLDEQVVEAQGTEQVGPVERTFLHVIELAVSIRRDGLVNPITVMRLNSQDYQIETGERRWLAYHMLYTYFNGHHGKPNESDKWKTIPAMVVDEINVWRQASENAARADLNAIGRARQFAILMMDLLQRQQDIRFDSYDQRVNPAGSDREYYAQVVDYRVPNGRGELLLNGLGVSHRSAFTRCRTLLSLPDAVWDIGDNLDLTEDELLRLSKLEPQVAIREAQRIESQIVATRNNSDETTPTPASAPRQKSPTLFTDAALKRGKRLFSRQNQLVVQELFSIKDGVGQANAGTKKQIRDQIDAVRGWLDKLEEAMKSD